MRQALDILARLGAQPATSFMEAGVAGVVREVLDEGSVPYQTDSYGNIIAHLQGSSTGGSVPPIAFMAHMDHPGFEAIAMDGDFLVGVAMGGVPQSSFEAGVPVQVILPDGQRLAAGTAGPFGEPSERKALISLEDASRLSEVPLPSSVVFDLVDFQLEDGFIRMRAVDDLAGVGSTLAMLSALAGQDEPPAGDVYGVFTRAEEVGLVGARLLAEAGTLPTETLVVSLESSRTLPGAEIGSGPVIRVGDAGFTFNADAEARPEPRPGDAAGPPRGVQGAAAADERRHLRGQRLFRLRLPHHRHRLPPGQLPQRRPDGGIEAEYIHEEDYLGGVD